MTVADATRYVGTELGTVELLGEIDRGAPIAAAAVAAGVVELAPRPELSVVILAMRGLRSRRLGWPRFDYGEVLWRIGARRGDVPVWIAARCDLDSRLVGVMARRLMRYDVHRATIAIDDAGDARRVTIEARDGRLAATVTASGDPIDPPATRPLLVDGGRLSLAWHEHAVGATHHAGVAFEDDGLLRALLGPDSRIDRGVLYTRRDHACGVARPS
jgi:hypothetical protein